MPILDDAAAWFVGKILDRFRLGDHVGHSAGTGGRPARRADLEYSVSFGDVHDLQPGHEA